MSCFDKNLRTNVWEFLQTGFLKSFLRHILFDQNLEFSTSHAVACLGIEDDLIITDFFLRASLSACVRNCERSYRVCFHRQWVDDFLSQTFSNTHHHPLNYKIYNSTWHFIIYYENSDGKFMSHILVNLWCIFWAWYGKFMVPVLVINYTTTFIVHKLVLFWTKHGAYFGHKLVLFCPSVKYGQ